MNIFTSQRAKRNWLHIGFIALVIGIVIMLNAIVTVLGDKYDWYGDMTSEELYTISDALREAVSSVENEVGIDIIFCCTKDYAEKNLTGENRADSLSYVHSTAEQLAKEFDNINIAYHDTVKEPDYFKNSFTEIERFLNGIESPVIVARRGADGGYGTHFKVYAARSFYGFSSSDSSLYAYNGEAVFASAILGLSYDTEPTVYFVKGHNERLYNKTSDGKNAPISLINLFALSGFKVEELDLAEGDIPTDARMVIINEPEFDYSASEIERLDTYMANKGSVMIFTNPNYNDNLSRLYSFVYARAGVKVNTEGKVTDEKTNLATDKLSLRGEVSSSAAAKTYLSYLSDYTAARPFFTNSASITIDEAFMSNEGVYEGDSYTYTQPLFMTSESGEYKGVKGNHLLMSVTAILKGKSTGDAYSYLVFAPSSGFAMDEALSNQAYPNYDIVLSLVHSMTAVQTTVDIDYKAFANYDLDITEAQAKTATVILAVVVPLAVIITGAVILLRRKRR